MVPLDVPITRVDKPESQGEADEQPDDPEQRRDTDQRPDSQAYTARHDSRDHDRDPGQRRIAGRVGHTACSLSPLRLFPRWREGRLAAAPSGLWSIVVRGLCNNFVTGSRAQLGPASRARDTATSVLPCHGTPWPKSRTEASTASIFASESSA